jgi:hypothetical protein
MWGEGRPSTLALEALEPDHPAQEDRVSCAYLPGDMPVTLMKAAVKLLWCR